MLEIRIYGTYGHMEYQFKILYVTWAQQLETDRELPVVERGF